MFWVEMIYFLTLLIWSILVDMNFLWLDIVFGYVLWLDIFYAWKLFSIQILIIEYEITLINGFEWYWRRGDWLNDFKAYNLFVIMFNDNGYNN